MKSAKRIARLLRKAAEELEKAEDDFITLRDLIPNPDWLLYDKEGRVVGVAAWVYADYEDTGEITADTNEQVRINHEYIWVYYEELLPFPLSFELEEGFLEWAEELGLRVEEQ